MSVQAQSAIRQVGRRYCPVWVRSILLQAGASVMTFLRAPYYAVTTVLGQFILPREDPADEVVGHGAGKAVGGLVYWLMIAKKARKFGLFGLAHDCYMGMPLSVHNWPLSIAALVKLGYRRTVYISVLILAAGLAWLAVAAGHPYAIVLVPLILFSTYCTFNIYAGVLELLPWGLFIAAFACATQQLYLFTGICLAGIILSHPGAALSSMLTLICYGVLSGHSAHGLFEMTLAAAALSFWFVIPYLRCRRMLGRERIINEVWQAKYSWSSASAYQFGIYALFLSAVILSGERSLSSLYLILPLMALVYNIKRYWLFSAYTLYNYMMVSGAVYLVLHPTILPIIAYLFVIYTPCSTLLWSGKASFKGFDLTPLTLGNTRGSIQEMFAGLKPGRVAVELGDRSHPGWTYMASLGYILADMDVDLFNNAYAEVGDVRIFHKYCRHLNGSATQKEFETACRDAGIKYIVCLTDEFAATCAARRYVQHGQSIQAQISNEEQLSPVSLAVFELPLESSIIKPPVEVTQSPNRLQFQAEAGTNYHLTLTCFPGWRASQNGRGIRMADDSPGISIRCTEDGPVDLTYSYRNYFRRQEIVR